MSLDGVPTPALLLDLDVLERNLRRMSERAAALGVAMRPHIKTHKSPGGRRAPEGAGDLRHHGLDPLRGAGLRRRRLRGRDLGLPRDPDPARRGGGAGGPDHAAAGGGFAGGGGRAGGARPAAPRLAQGGLRLPPGRGRSRVAPGPGAGPPDRGVADADLRRPADPLRARLPRAEPGGDRGHRRAGAQRHGGVRRAAAGRGDRGPGGERGLDAGPVRRREAGRGHRDPARQLLLPRLRAGGPRLLPGPRLRGHGAVERGLQPAGRGPRGGGRRGAGDVQGPRAGPPRGPPWARSSPTTAPAPLEARCG